jgi:hypothetical protein
MNHCLTLIRSGDHLLQIVENESAQSYKLAMVALRQQNGFNTVLFSGMAYKLNTKVASFRNYLTSTGKNRYPRHCGDRQGHPPPRPRGRLQAGLRHDPHASAERHHHLATYANLTLSFLSPLSSPLLFY